MVVLETCSDLKAQYVVIVQHKTTKRNQDGHPTSALTASSLSLKVLAV